MPTYVFLIFLHLFAIEWGLSVGAVNAHPILIFIRLAFAIVVVTACATDAARRGTPIVQMGKFLMLISWPVTVPLYLVWSRGWRGLLWSMLWAFTLYLCFAVPALWVTLPARAG